MSKGIKQTSQRGIIVLLSVISVLLVALIVTMIVMFSGSAGSSSDTSSSAMTSSAQEVTFDPATATKVPAGMTPQQLIEAYSNDVIDGKYEEAFKLLPLGSQLGYGSASSFATTLKAYNISSYKMGGSTETSDTMAIAAAQVTPELSVAYTWFFKKVGDQWYVESRALMDGTSLSSSTTTTTTK